jgi:hypothetical protein
LSIAGIDAMGQFQAQTRSAKLTYCELGMSEEPMFFRAVFFLSACVSGLIAEAGIASGAEIIVMSDTPVAAALNRIAEAFHQRTGNEVRFVFGLSPTIRPSGANRTRQQKLKTSVLVRG